MRYALTRQQFSNINTIFLKMYHPEQTFGKIVNIFASWGMNFKNCAIIILSMFNVLAFENN